MIGMNFNAEEIAKNVMIKQFGNEQNAISQLRKMAGNHPVLKNAVDLLEKGDKEGLQNLGNNVMRENNQNPMSMIQNMFMGGRNR